MKSATAHLSDEEFALYTDAIVLNCQSQVPKAIQYHVTECLECKKELLELQWLLEIQKSLFFLEPHPFFSTPIA